MESINLFIRTFVVIKNHFQRVENQNKEICTFIKVNRNFDVHCFNDIVQTDVEVIFNTIGDELPLERNIISFSKVSVIFENISVSDSSLDHLEYLVLFPDDDVGWHINISHNLPTTSNSRASRKKLAMLQ